MIDITLTRLEVRTGNTPSWLYLRGVFESPHDRNGRIWILAPLDNDPSHGQRTLLDPDSDGETRSRGIATGMLRFNCGCSRGVVSLLTELTGGGLKVGAFLRYLEAQWGSSDGGKHHSSPADLWYQNPEPALLAMAHLSAEELTTIRHAVTARRDGVESMSLAGLHGAAGVHAVETQSLDVPDLTEALTAMAALRGGVQPQLDPAWFRVR